MIISSLHSWDDTRILFREALTLVRHYEVELHAIAPFHERVYLGVRVVGLRPRGRWTRPVHWITLGYRALRSRAQVVHFHDPELLLIAFLLRLMGKRVVYDVHEDVVQDILTKNWIPRYLRRVVARVYCLIQAAADRVLSGIIVATDPIARYFYHPQLVVVKNYPPLEFFQNGGNYRSAYSSGNPIRLIYVGSISQNRGILKVLEACRHLPGELAYQLDVLGGFPQGLAFSQEVRAAAKELDGRVTFHGRKCFEEVVEAMGQAHIGLVCTQPSPNDVVGLPLKLFEYMAAGLGVVLSDFAPWYPFVAQYPPHEFVNPTHPEDIARGIVGLAKRLPSFKEHHWSKIRQAAALKYNWLSQETQLLRLYQYLLPTGRQP